MYASIVRVTCVIVIQCVQELRWFIVSLCIFFQAEDGIRDLVRSRGLGDVYKRQVVGIKRHITKICRDNYF